MIYIVKHKKYDNPVPEGYKELHVGKMSENVISINHLNPYINEATALYDIWKNYDDEIVGLCHYRRFFYYEDEYLKLRQAKNILENYDMIITDDVRFDKGIYEQLRSEIEDPCVLDKYYRELIEEEPELEEWFKFKSFNPKEMFVCKRELLNRYCEWLFPLILPITAQFVRTDASNVVNKRMIGHLIERLFAYWIWKNKLKCYRMEYIEI